MVMGFLADSLNVKGVINLNDPEIRMKVRELRKLQPFERLEVLSVTFDKNEFEPIDTNPYDSDGMIMPEGYKEDDTDTDDNPIKDMDSSHVGIDPIKDMDSRADIDGDYTGDTNDNCIKDCDSHVDIGGDHNPIKDRDSHMDIGGDDTDNNPIKGRDNNNVDIGEDDADNNPIKGRDNNNVEIGEDDTDSNPFFRIFITDGSHVQEIYDPAKVDNLLLTPPLPLFGIPNSPKQARGDYSISGHQADLPLIGQNEEQEYQDSGRCVSPLLPKWDDSISGRNTSGLLLTSNLCEEEMQLSGSSQLGLQRKLSHVISQPTVLLMTGPNGDIVPEPFFDVIVCKDSKHTYESHKDWINRRMNNSCIVPPDVVSSWRARSLDSYNRRIELKVYCPFGALTLDCIVFSTSRLVTVGVKWLVEGSSGGENGKENHATTTETTYICGKLEFYNGEFEDMKSVLLDTPEDKAVMVKGDGSVPC